jgi:hypothetical protein
VATESFTAKAVRYRGLARDILDERTRQELLKLANDHDRAAEAAAERRQAQETAAPVSDSGRHHMENHVKCDRQSPSPSLPPF